MYISWVGPSAPTATVQLAAFAKVLLQPGQRTTVALRLEPRSLAVLHNASTTHSVYLDDAFNETEPVPSHVIVITIRTRDWLRFACVLRCRYG